MSDIVAVCLYVPCTADIVIAIDFYVPVNLCVLNLPMPSCGTNK